MLRLPLMLGLVLALQACVVASTQNVSSEAAQPAASDIDRQVVAAAQWPELAPTSGDDASEVRVWLDTGLVVPHHVVRLRHLKGRVQGEVVSWWENETELLNLRDPESGRTFGELHAARCPKLRKTADVVVCLNYLPSDVALKAWSDLYALGVWRLHERPLPAHGPFVVTADGEGVIIELRQSGVYRRMKFNTSNEQDFQFNAQASRIAMLTSRLLTSHVQQ